MNTGLELRRIAATELDGLLALYGQLHPDDAPPPLPDAVATAWQALLAQPGCSVLGAYRGGRLLASCTLFALPNLTRGCRSYGLIENVVTDAAQRRQGLGQALLRHALELAWAQHCYKVMLMTGRQDEATLRFYDAAGFDRHGKQGFVVRPPT